MLEMAHSLQHMRAIRAAGLAKRSRAAASGTRFVLINGPRPFYDKPIAARREELAPRIVAADWNRPRQGQIFIRIDRAGNSTRNRELDQARKFIIYACL